MVAADGAGIIRHSPLPCSPWRMLSSPSAMLGSVGTKSAGLAVPVVRSSSW